jgi:formylmethanofuran dehydrogenase subunit D
VANWENDVFKRSPAKIALPVYSAVTVQVAELQSQKVDEADEAMLSEEYSQ